MRPRYTQRPTMLRIRMMRQGRKNKALYRVAVFDSHTRRDGPCVEKLGDYDPCQKETAQKVKLNAERLKYWVGKGAQLTPAIARLLKHVGVTLAPAPAAKPEAKPAAKKKK